MADAGAAAGNAARGAVRTFRLLNAEQRAAAIGALLLIVSTFGPFSFVEAAEILLAVGVLALLRARAEGKRFHLPFGDGTAIAAAGVWACVLIVARLFDRPLGQNLLALACAAILIVAGGRERAKRPADDVPPEHGPPPLRREPDAEAAPEREQRPPRKPPPATPAAAATAPDDRTTERIEKPAVGEQQTLPIAEPLAPPPERPLPPPEFEPPARRPPPRDEDETLERPRDEPADPDQPPA
jgi:hypothetical protein